jgi:hypothetical protein
VLTITPYEIIEMQCRMNLKKSLDDVHAEIKRTCPDTSDPAALMRVHPLLVNDLVKSHESCSDPVSADKSVLLVYHEYASAYLFWAAGKQIYYISRRVLDATRERPLDFARSDYEPLDECAYYAFEEGAVTGERVIHGAFVHERTDVKGDEISRVIVLLSESQFDAYSVSNNLSYWPISLPGDLSCRTTEEQLIGSIRSSASPNVVLDILRAYLLVNKQSLPRKLHRRSLSRSQFRCPCCGSRTAIHTDMGDYRGLPSSLPYYEVELLGGAS